MNFTIKKDYIEKISGFDVVKELDNIKNINIKTHVGPDEEVGEEIKKSFRFLEIIQEIKTKKNKKVK